MTLTFAQCYTRSGFLVIFSVRPLFMLYFAVREILREIEVEIFSFYLSSPFHSLPLYASPFHSLALSMPLPFTLSLSLSPLSPISLLSLSLSFYISLFSLSFSLAYLMDVFVLGLNDDYFSIITL